MSCSSIDLKGYLLGELEQRDKALAQGHVSTCENCREELDRLRLTQTALLALPEEEVPQRIAFVSDKVFEPRWWQAIWRSGPAMGFASAALLAAAIFVHAFTRPPAIVSTAASLDAAQIEQRIHDEVARRVDAAVVRAVAASEERQGQQTAQMLEAAEKRLDQQRKEDLVAIQQVTRYYDQQMNRLMVASNDLMADRTRGGQ